jgi:hypothetical protein
MSKILPRRKPATTDVALVASSAPVDLPKLDVTWEMPGRQQPWQREVYRYRDVVGEVDYAARLMASAVSRARLYLAELGDTGDADKEVDTVKVRRILAKTLGGPDRRREEMKILGYNLFLAGEAFLLGIAGDTPDGDEWYGLSVNEFTRKAGKLTCRPKDKDIQIRSTDILRRVWLADPNQRSKARGPSKSARLVMRELEVHTKDVFARADSRLAGAGMLLWPAGTVVSGGSGSTADDVTKRMVNQAAESLKGTGTAESVVPIVIEAPPDVMDKIRHVTFSSDQQKTSVEQRAECIRRLALQMDMTPEQLLGMSDASHWSAWYIDASSAHAHVIPMLDVICEAIYNAQIAPILARTPGMDPKKYALRADISALIIRPQLLKDTLDLYERGLVSADEVLRAGSYLPGAAPGEKERAQRYLRELVLRDPQQINTAAIREALGLDVIIPADSSLVETQPLPTPPPAPERATGQHTLPTTPETRSGESTLGTEQGTMTASAGRRVDAVTLALADAAAQRTLELAGGRLLNGQRRFQFADTPRWALHTRIKADPDRIPKLVEGGGVGLADTARRHGVRKPEVFAAAVCSYAAMVIRNAQPHDVGILEQVLDRALGDD